MIRYIYVIFISMFFVFNQVFFFDLFATSIKVILLLICYIMINDVKRDVKQFYLFFIFFLFEILTFNTPGYLTLIVLILEYFYDYLKNLFQINIIFILEFFSYFLIYFYFINGLFDYTFFINLCLTLVMFLVNLVGKYGFTKIFRIRNK